MVTIDTPLMETYMDYTSYNQNMRGDYPKLLAGDNVVSWTGGVAQIVITPNWRNV
jgi:phage-related protein